MIKKLIYEQTRDVVWLSDLSETFYKYENCPEDSYSINNSTGLKYFGEYLERHVQTDITVAEIMAAVVIRNNEKFEKYTIYQGQLEMFLDRISKTKETEGSFEFNLLSLMFYSKFNLTERFNALLEEISNAFGDSDNFLLFTLAVQENFIECTTSVKQVALSFLKRHSFSVDIEKIHNSAKWFDFSFHKFSTSLPAFKFLLSAYGLKKSDFKDCPEKFESYKELKKIGTKDSDFEACKSVLNFDAQSFYYIALKIAGETYRTKAAISKANDALVLKLEDSINVNSNIYWYFPDIVLYFNGDICSGLIELEKADYSVVEKEYYPSLIEAYTKTENKRCFLEVLKRVDFLEYIRNNDSLKNSFILAKIAMNVIKHCDDDSIVNDYADLIRGNTFLDYSDIMFLCEKSLLDLSELDEILYDASKENSSLSSSRSLRWILDCCSEKKLSKTGLYFIEKVVKDNVIIGDYSSIENEVKRFIELIDDNIIKVAKDNNIKKQIFLLLEEFILLYVSSYYVEFLIMYADDDIFRATFNIDDESLKEIGEYLITKRYVKEDSIKEKVLKFIYSESEIIVNNCKKEIDNHITFVHKYNKEYSSESLIDAIKKVNNKKIVSKYYKEKLGFIEKDFKGVSTFVNVIKFMTKNDLLHKSEAMSLIEEQVL